MIEMCFSFNFENNLKRFYRFLIFQNNLIKNFNFKMKVKKLSILEKVLIKFYLRGFNLKALGLKEIKSVFF